MPHSDIAFDARVAERLARIADATPTFFPLFLECVRSWLPRNASSLIQVAQQGSPQMARALLESLAAIGKRDDLETLFHALPKRTVMLRDFAIAVAHRLVDATTNDTLTPDLLILKSQLGARMREGGRPADARDILEEVVSADFFSHVSPLLQAHVLANLGAAVADLGLAQQSFTYHKTSIALLDTPHLEAIEGGLDLLLGEYVNAAAAGLRLRSYAEVEALIRAADNLLVKAPDRSMSFRLRLLAFTLHAERHEFAEALLIGQDLLPLIEDFEEESSDVYRSIFIDALINVGSVALDEFAPDQAESYFVRALSLARAVVQHSDSPQARLKQITTQLALLTARLQRGLTGITGEARALLLESTSLFEKDENEYAREICGRVREVVVRAATEDESERPSVSEIDELLTWAQRSDSPGSEDPWSAIRVIHTAALALAKLGDHQRALHSAHDAVARAAALAEPESAHDRAQRALLLDSLSRRLEDTNNRLSALDTAENALTVLEICWLETPEKYSFWMERLFAHYRRLCEKSSQMNRFEAFCTSRLGE